MIAAAIIIAGAIGSAIVIGLSDIAEAIRERK